jgi:coenzyme F420-reducing hydrogenase delta subunit
MDASRIRVAAICSVCAEPFTKHMTNFSAALVSMGPAKAE